ncbi:MAG: hypothetical protein HY280_11385 [Nitrospinae bacterium]|nr:hypothetical protein [Nitrospinota bacterium]
MSEDFARNKIERNIVKKKAEIQELENKLLQEKAYLQALEDSIKHFSKDSPGGETSMRENSSAGLARSALRKHGKRMHINDILKAIGKPLTKKDRQNLSGTLAAYVRRRDTFTRPSPGVYGLIEFEKNGENENEETSDD